MRNDFYTMGGSHFWEDVFFYQKWRIQRNCISKKCRLLDNWDIRRHEGTFEECRKAFVKYISAYEISRQKGHMVIMLHGLGESKNIFKPLWREVLKKKLLAAAVNYPSTQKDIDGHVRQLIFFLNHLEDVQEVSFVTKGIGSLVLRRLFSVESEWQQKLKIGRIVEVAPMNRGSRLMEKFHKNKIISFILGPIMRDAAPKKAQALPRIPKNIETGIILSPSLLTRIVEFLTRTSMPKVTAESEKKNSGAKEVIEMSVPQFNLFNNKELVARVVNFLTTGHFGAL